uniref:Uncharacterized protein n=1 Tax=Haptolina brevifila TaxID=156173 RepID=A0A7S2N6K2_9EUKA|mmetsp:Transcript_67970/g.134729  ORF Transcript_67970/g.134729 Transcript_67970/m.134729 type:complete len:149 (+) Transcript_67970:75-521(+)
MNMSGGGGGIPMSGGRWSETRKWTVHTTMPIRPTVSVPSLASPPPKLPPVFFPGIYYPARGAPKHRAVQMTTYGYELKLARDEHQMMRQQALPRNLSATRPRFDACCIRPERALSVQQIRDGVYFARPDPETYARLLAEARQPAVTSE